MQNSIHSIIIQKTLLLFQSRRWKVFHRNFKSRIKRDFETKKVENERETKAEDSLVYYPIGKIIRGADTCESQKFSL